MASRGFNPCRVFSGLATHVAALETHFPRPSFNPCRVFSGLATEAGGGPPRRDDHVSIPVGFFQALQPRSDSPAKLAMSRFNPCRVFSGLATSA